MLRRSIGPLALCAFISVTQNAALAAAPPGATAAGTASPAASAPAASTGSIHDRAGGKPVAVVYDSSKWTDNFATIAQGVSESAQDFATKFGKRFNVETTVIQVTIKAPKDVDDAVKASGAQLGLYYGATAKGEPHSHQTDWAFGLRTKFRDGNGTPWLDLKKEVDVTYPGLSDYHAITVKNLSTLNDQIIDELEKASAK